MGRHNCTEHSSRGRALEIVLCCHLGIYTQTSTVLVRHVVSLNTGFSLTWKIGTILYYVGCDTHSSALPFIFEGESFFPIFYCKTSKTNF